MAISDDGPRKIVKIFAARGVVFSPQQAALLNVLLGRERLVTYRTLAEALWGDDPEGGPLDAQGHLRAALAKVRPKIRAAGALTSSPMPSARTPPSSSCSAP